MKLHELSPAPGSVQARRRVGRGVGSGLGKTSGKGHKGQKARSGGGKGAYFEGGQRPMTQRIPKYGFVNVFHKEYACVNVSDLETFEAGSTVNLDTFMETGKIKKPLCGLKILGDGELSKNLTVQAVKFSASAKEKIEAAGGKAEVV